MWHASLRSVSFSLLKSCNLRTHDEQFPLLRDKGRLHSSWLDREESLLDRWDSWSDFGNSVDCNLERKIWVHGRPGQWLEPTTVFGFRSPRWVSPGVTMPGQVCPSLVPLRLCSLNRMSEQKPYLTWLWILCESTIHIVVVKALAKRPLFQKSEM